MVRCCLMFKEFKISVKWLGEKFQTLLMNDDYFVAMDVLRSKFIRTSITRNLTIDHDCNLVAQKLSFFDVVSNHDHGRALDILDDVQ